ncbi:hypothetical protein L1049_014000 [Liquidambar formosana]|uniref:Stress induced protein n=1 Tax=Liquidambar formosana TaxID=63359 RepID=A0AAP0WUU8_LIQFO
MATPQEKAASISELSPLEENDDCVEDDYEETFTGCGCGWLWQLCFRRKHGSYRYLLQQQGEKRESWFVEKVKKVKQVSEVVAGPKWKNFIRRFRGYCNNNNNNNNNNKRRMHQFQYDPRSYALNFDDGVIDREVDGAHLGFSARFAAPIKINNGELGRD